MIENRIYLINNIMTIRHIRVPFIEHDTCIVMHSNISNVIMIPPPANLQYNRTYIGLCRQSDVRKRRIRVNKYFHFKKTSALDSV